MYLAYASLLYQLMHIGGGNTASSQYLDIGDSYQLSYHRRTFYGRGSLAGSKQPMATAGGNNLQGLHRFLACFVEGTVKGHLHRGGQLHHIARKPFIHKPFSCQEAYNHSGSSQIPASENTTLDFCHLSSRVAEIARPRTHQDMCAQAELAHTVVDIFIARGESPTFQVAAKLHTLCPTLLCRHSRSPRRRTNFHLNHFNFLRISSV